MKKPSTYLVDLTKIEGDGSFNCPKCGALISPDDETETVYRILNTKMRGEELEELTIQCNICNSKIRIVGFLALTVPSVE